jgi:hypothetical protein
MNKVSAKTNYRESNVSLRNDERDLADTGPRICCALMIQWLGRGVWGGSPATLKRGKSKILLCIFSVICIYNEVKHSNA